jgi:hypothetical protein
MDFATCFHALELGIVALLDLSLALQTALVEFVARISQSFGAVGS